MNQNDAAKKPRANSRDAILVHELSARAIGAIRSAAVRPLLNANKQRPNTVQWSGMNHGSKNTCTGKCLKEYHLSQLKRTEYEPAAQTAH
jgi:hypothetical protein